MVPVSETGIILELKGKVTAEVPRSIAAPRTTKHKRGELEKNNASGRAKKHAGRERKEMGLHRSRRNVSHWGDDTLWKRAWAHFKHEWTSAVFVASLITIANLHFDWLKAFETYAYLAIGQLTAVGSAAFHTEPRAAVVTIDAPTFEERYRERSPLNRCELKSQLAAIYNAKPDVMVLDVAISPTYLLADSCKRDPRGALCAEWSCEGDLYGLIVARGKAK